MGEADPHRSSIVIGEPLAEARERRDPKFDLMPVGVPRHPIIPKADATLVLAEVLNYESLVADAVTEDERDLPMPPPDQRCPLIPPAKFSAQDRYISMT